MNAKSLKTLIEKNASKENYNHTRKTIYNNFMETVQHHTTPLLTSAFCLQLFFPACSTYVEFAYECAFYSVPSVQHLYEKIF